MNRLVQIDTFRFPYNLIQFTFQTVVHGGVVWWYGQLLRNILVVVVVVVVVVWLYNSLIEFWPSQPTFLSILFYLV